MNDLVSETVLDELAARMRERHGDAGSIGLPEMEGLAMEVGVAHGLDGETVLRSFIEARGDRYSVELTPSSP